MSLRVDQGLPQAQGPGEDPLLHYTAVFCRFLQLAFGTFPSGSYHWDQDEKISDIVIGDQAPIGREVVEKRPAIVVSRGEASFGNVGLDQFSSYDFATAKRSHTDLVACMMTYNCLSEEGLEAQRLAWLSMMMTRRLKRALMKAGIHRVGEELAVSAESPPGSIVSGDASEIIKVSVTVPFYFQDFWSVEEQDKNLLKGINLGLTSERVTVRPPEIHGQPLRVERTTSLTQRVTTSTRSTPRPRE